MNTTMQPLVEVFCQNPYCGFWLKRGKRCLVGRISERGELRCPSCRRVMLFEV
jgi:hypothetical protein